MSLQQKMRKLKLTPLPMTNWPAPVQIALDDGNLPDENKIVASEGNVESMEVVTSCRQAIQ